MTILPSISQKKNKSLQLTTALYYLPIVLRMKTKHKFIPFKLWSPDWKVLQNFVCRTLQYGIALKINSEDLFQDNFGTQCTSKDQLRFTLGKVRASTNKDFDISKLVFLLHYYL